MAVSGLVVRLDLHDQGLSPLRTCDKPINVTSMQRPLSRATRRIRIQIHLDPVRSDIHRSFDRYSQSALNVKYLVSEHKRVLESADKE